MSQLSLLAILWWKENVYIYVGGGDGMLTVKGYRCEWLLIFNTSKISISLETTDFPIKLQKVFSFICISNQIYLWTLQYDIFYVWEKKNRWSGASLPLNGVPFVAKFNRRSVITIQICFNLKRFIDVFTLFDTVRYHRYQTVHNALQPTFQRSTCF